MLLPVHSTFRQDCPASIYLRVNGDGTALQIKSINNEHNHEISRVSGLHVHRCICSTMELGNVSTVLCAKCTFVFFEPPDT